jgi:hypothetical protein
MFASRDARTPTPATQFALPVTFAILAFALLSLLATRNSPPPFVILVSSLPLPHSPLIRHSSILISIVSYESPAPLAAHRSLLAPLC